MDWMFPIDGVDGLAPCHKCNGTGKDPKKRKRQCQFCCGKGQIRICSVCKKSQSECNCEYNCEPWILY